MRLRSWIHKTNEDYHCNFSICHKHQVFVHAPEFSMGETKTETMFGVKSAVLACMIFLVEVEIS